MSIASDIPQRVKQLPRTVIDYDRSLLNENERQVIAKLIEASKVIDEIYWRQVSEANPDLRAKLQPAGGPAYEYLLMNRGPWDRLKQDEPFIGSKPKPHGAAFYPDDLTKEEFERYTGAHPQQRDALQGLLTVVRRDGTDLVAIPYSAFYRDLLQQAAARLREAAALTTDQSLKAFLTKRADAFLSDNYQESDMAWMDLNGKIEVVIGPYEVYEDELFNYKAAFESFVTVVDHAESEKLAVYAAHLPDMERNLPEPEQYKNFNRGTSSPIKVVQELYTAGDARRGVQTSAFNLPNDEVVREKKGSKKVLLKNVMDAKFKQSGRPIAMRVLDPSLVNLVAFEPYFNHTLFHELSHGLGPGIITLNGERVDSRIPLKNLYSAIEECKADVLGLWNIRYAIDNKLLTSFDERQLYATYTGLMFRSMRFGINEAHGRGTAVQWNWIREKGGVTPIGGGKFTMDIDKFRGGRGFETAQSLRARGEKGYPVERILRDMRINRIFEGTSEIQHLFIAREAVDPHMKRGYKILLPETPTKEKIEAAAKAGAHYAAWYPSKFVGWSRFPKFGDFGKLSSHVGFIERSSRHLARSIFHAMMRYQARLEKKQMVLFRIVDIGTDLFAMSAAISYATMLSKKRDDRSNAMDLADVFCREARMRVETNFRQLFDNHDDESYKLVTKLLKGEYDWFKGQVVEPVVPTAAQVEEAMRKLA